jgi:hypothetical protein
MIRRNRTRGLARAIEPATDNNRRGGERGMSATHDESHPVDKRPAADPRRLVVSRPHGSDGRPLERPPTRGWWLGFVLPWRWSACSASPSAGSSTKASASGDQPSRGLGVRLHQPPLLGGSRPRRHADLRRPAAAPSALAGRSPRLRGDGVLRLDLRRVRRRPPPRPAVAGLLAGPGTEPDGNLASVPQPARVEPVRSRRLQHGHGAFLRRVAPRSRHSRDRSRDAAEDLRGARLGLARLAAPLAPPREARRISPDRRRPCRSGRSRSCR